MGVGLLVTTAKLYNYTVGVFLSNTFVTNYLKLVTAELSTHPLIWQ